jgi:hypothetical protein
MRGLRPLALALAFAAAALPLAASAAKAPAPKDRQAALLKFQQDLASVLALRTEAQPLLGAALLARPLTRPPETLTYHALLERAARGDGAGPSVTWAQLADCDGKAGTCPNADAMASLKQQVPDNAAVWMLALGRDLAAAKDEDVRSDLTRAAQAKTYDDYLGSSLQALARTVSQLPPPPETYDPLSGAGSAGVQLTIVYGLGATQPLPAFPATARYCESHKDDEGIRNDCLGLGKVLEWGSSPLGRSLGLHLREVLSPDDAQQADARRARVNLVWQMQNFAQLNVRAQGEKQVAQRLLMLARNGGTEMSVILASLNAYGIPAEAPAGYTPARPKKGSE